MQDSLPVSDISPPSGFLNKNKAVIETWHCLGVRGNEKADLAQVKNGWNIKHQI